MKKQSNRKKGLLGLDGISPGTKIIIFFTISFVIFLLDQLTKFFARKNLETPFQLINNKVYLYLVYNPGAAFGMLKGARIFLILLTMILLALFFYNLKQILNTKYWLASALVFGGAIGNFFDRIYFGVTTDFINVLFWPAFNIADTCISTGATILIIQLIKEK